jgi:hypothetical protein
MHCIKSIIEKIKIKFKLEKHHSPTTKNNQLANGNNNTQILVGRDVNVGAKFSWKEKRDAAEKIKNAFNGLFFNLDSLKKSINKSLYNNYVKVFKKHINDNLHILNENDQKIIQKNLDNILSKTAYDEIMQSKNDVLISIDKILNFYFE